MSVIPSGNEVGLQLAGTAISAVTGVPFLGTVLASVFGNSKRPRFQDQYWSRAAAPNIHSAAEQAAANKLLRQQYRADPAKVEQYYRHEKGEYVLRSSLRPTRAEQAAQQEAGRQLRITKQTAKDAARQAEKQARKNRTRIR